MMTKSIVKSIKWKLLILMWVLSLAISFFGITTRMFRNTHTVAWTSYGMYLRILLISIPLAVCLYIIVLWVENRNQSAFIRLKDKFTWYKRLEAFLMADNKRFIFIAAGVMLICWIPAFLATFPGIYSQDAYPQMRQILGVEGYSSHHPILHTLFLGGCLQAGNFIFGSYNAGVVIHSIVQSTIMAFIFAYACLWIRRIKAPTWVSLFGILFFAFNPYNQIMVLTTTKDVLFAGFFMIWIMKSIELILDKDEFVKKKGNIIAWCVSAVLMMQIRNQGVYILILIAPFFIIALRKKWKTVTAMFAICLCIQLSISNVLFPALGIAEGDKREMLSVPMQQIARTLTSDTAVVTDEQREKVYKLIPKEYIDSYLDFSADPVKSGFNTAELSANMGEYIKLYAELGIQNTKIYLDAVYALAYANWYPFDTEIRLFYDGSYVEESKELMGIERTTLFPFYDKCLRTVESTRSIDRLPVISAVFSAGMQIWILLFLSLIIIYKKRYRLLFVMMIPILYWATLLLGPVSLIRYGWILMILMPMEMALFLYLLTPNPKMPDNPPDRLSSSEEKPLQR